MARSGRKKVYVQYRKLEDLVGSFEPHTLQSALSSCLKQAASGGIVADSVKSRQYENDKVYGTIVLNYMEDKQPFFFGEIVRFEPGADLPLLQIGTNVVPYRHEVKNATNWLVPLGSLRA